jgi:hypothetical protein
VDNGSTILAAFQNSCGSIGSWTAAAQAQTQGFISLIASIQSTPACAPYQQQLTQMQALGSQIAAVTSNSSYVAYRETQEQVQELTLALQSATSASQISALSSALTAAQVNLATQRGTALADQSVAGQNRLWTQAGQVSNYMGALMSAVNPNSSPTLGECLRQSPAAAVGLAANLLSFGGSFMSSTVGAATSVIGQIVSMGMQIFQETTYDQATDALNAAELPIALSCGLESMSELYCGADDSYSLIQLAANSYDSSAHPAVMFRGLDLLGRRFPVLTAWLQEVENGVPPANPTQAGQQEAVEQELEQVEVTDLAVTGAINQAVQFYNASNGTNISFLLNGIVSLADTLGQLDIVPAGGSSGTAGVFTQFETRPFRWACWMVLGQVPDAICAFPAVSSGGLTQSQVVSYVSTLLAHVDQGLVNSLLSNWKLEYQNVYDYVMVQFSQTITTNADSLLAEAKQQNNNLSPYGVLMQTSDFIDEMLKEQNNSNPRLTTTLVSKKEMIDKVEWYIDASDQDVKDWGDGGGPIQLCPKQKISPKDPNSMFRVMTGDECQRWRLSKIFELFDLKDGVQVFTTDIDKFITWDLQHRLDQGELPKDVSEILETAGIDISLRMQESGLSNLGDVQKDLNNSRKLSEDNLRVFRSFFSPAFSVTVKDLAQKAATEPQEGPNRPNGELLGRLCTLWFITQQDGIDFPDPDTEAVCQQSKLYSIYAKKDASGHYIPSLDLNQTIQQLKGRPFMDRVCTYHEYLRQERLAEIIKNTP